MMYGFSKYHGAGNDFLLADNRDGHLSLSPTMIRHLCDRHVGFGADGVMLLETVTWRISGWFSTILTAAEE